MSLENTNSSLDRLNYPKLKLFLRIQSGNFIEKNDFRTRRDSIFSYPVYGGNGLIGFTNKYNVLPDTIVVGRVGALCGNVHLITEKAWVTDNSLVLNILLRDKLKYTFLYYLLKSLNLNQYSQSTAQPLITSKTIKERYFKLPSISDQESVASFISKKTTEIDTLISDKEKLIALLEEKRQAIITEAVTKGLDPDVKMKDSDVEWIGEIPEHWKVSKLKYFAKVIMGQSIDSQSISYNNEDIPFLQGNAEFGSLHPKAKSYCSFGKKYAEKGDILLSVRAPVGALNISDKTYAIGRGLSSIRVPSKLVPFFWFALKVYKKELLSKVTGSTFDAVAIEDVKNLIFPIPSNEEMISIGKELDTYDKRTLAIIKSLRIQLVKLKEYRQALIYEAVTGKIDVQEILKETEQEEVSSS